MKKKYKYYIFINVCVTTALVGYLGIWLALRNPENTYLIGVTAFLIHLSILAVTNRLISKKARHDIDLNS